MTCYLGEDVFVTGNCSAVIVSNGHPGEEKSAFPGDRAMSVTMLKTVDGCNYVGGGMSILYYWNGAAWVEFSRTAASAGDGYSYVKWSWGAAIGNWWIREAWEDCVRVFRVGNPAGTPCEKYVTVGVKSIDPATKKAIAGSILYLKPRDAGYETKWCKTDSSGQCAVSGICAGIGYDMQISVPGYESLKDYIAPTTNVVYTWPLATTPPSVTPPSVLPEELAQEKTERQQADAAEKQERQQADASENQQRRLADTAEKLERQQADMAENQQRERADAGLAGTISGLQAALDGFKAWIVDGILDVIWSALTREKKVG